MLDPEVILEKKKDILGKINRYQVIRELGRGGMGVVYLAHDPFIERQVAIKTTLTPPPDDPRKFKKFYKRFFNEAKAAGKLIHPNIVSVYDAMIENDLFYLVMEYVEGRALITHCREENLLPIDEVVDIIFQCAKALHFAHENGVIHRDIKPNNIIISSGNKAKISDFGIAKIKGSGKRLWSGSLPSSVYYISPERFRDEKLTPQSDLFSLGVLMYELFTGTRPFEADTDVGVVFKILNETPRFSEKFKRKIPEFLQHIVLGLLEKDLEKRYKTGLQVASELSKCFDHLKFVDEEINYARKINILKKLTFFKDFLPSEIAEVIKATSWLKCEADSIIINEGEIEDCFYIIGIGELLVIKNGRTLATLKRGDCFGEMAYLGRSERTATIKALTESVLIKINSTDIENMSLRTQLNFYKVFNSTLIMRLVRASESLSKGLSGVLES